MLLCVSVFLILLIFELPSIVSVLDWKVSTLAQMVGVLNEKMQLMERQQKSRPGYGAEVPLGRRGRRW